MSAIASTLSSAMTHCLLGDRLFTWPCQQRSMLLDPKRPQCCLATQVFPFQFQTPAVCPNTEAGQNVHGLFGIVAF